MQFRRISNSAKRLYRRRRVRDLNTGEKSVQIADNILSSSKGIIKLAGLGARDSLRLEAGLCLHSNDIDETISPVEALVVWTIGKRRKELTDFLGTQKILKQLKEKSKQSRFDWSVFRCDCQMTDAYIG